MPSVSIIPHGNGWRVVYREGGRGSKRHWTETRKTKAEAGVDADAVRARLLTQTPIKPGRIRIPWSEIVDRWYGTRAQGRYRDEAVKFLRAIPWMGLEEATPDYVASLKLGRRRLVNSVISFARTRLRQAIDMDIASQPMPRSSRPPKARPSLLADEVIDALVREAGEWSAGNGAIAHIVAAYGHRAASLVGLTGSAFDLGASPTMTLKVKSGDVVTHPLLPETVEILRQLDIKPDTPAFLSQNGTRWKTGKAFSEWFFHRVGPAALAMVSAEGETVPGPKIGYYQVKSSAITRMLDATGNDAKTVASITGHRKPSLLIDVYARTNEDRQMAALAGARPAGTRKSEPGVSQRKR